METDAQWGATFKLREVLCGNLNESGLNLESCGFQDCRANVESDGLHRYNWNYSLLGFER